MSNHWPLFDLVLRIEDLELRTPIDEDIAALARLAAGGVGPEGYHAAGSTWLDEPSPKLEQGVVQTMLDWRATVAPAEWKLGFVVRSDGELIGMQMLGAKEFGIRRNVMSGSWLGREHFGKGAGTLMRVAALAFAFEHLGAVTATSGWVQGDNPASSKIARKFGYELDGVSSWTTRDVRVWMQQARLTRPTWLAQREQWPGVEVEGLEACLPLLLGDASTEPFQPDVLPVREEAWA